MITAAQAYALSIIDRTPKKDRQAAIDYLCSGLDALGNPKDETNRIRVFLEQQVREDPLTVAPA